MRLPKLCVTMSVCETSQQCRLVQLSASMPAGVAVLVAECACGCAGVRFRVRVSVSVQCGGRDWVKRLCG